VVKLMNGIAGVGAVSGTAVGACAAVSVFFGQKDMRYSANDILPSVREYGMQRCRQGEVLDLRLKPAHH
jgi:hypothetical protein